MVKQINAIIEKSIKIKYFTDYSEWSENKFYLLYEIKYAE